MKGVFFRSATATTAASCVCVCVGVLRGIKNKPSQCSSRSRAHQLHIYETVNLEPVYCSFPQCGACPVPRVSVCMCVCVCARQQIILQFPVAHDKISHCILHPLAVSLASCDMRPGAARRVGRPPCALAVVFMTCNFTAIFVRSCELAQVDRISCCVVGSRRRRRARRRKRMAVKHYT